MAQNQYGQESDPLLPSTAYAPSGNLKSTKTTCKKIGCALAAICGVCAAILIIVLTIYFWDRDIYVQYRFEHAAVASDAGPCSEIGSHMLEKGGTAVDAAIAGLLCINLFNPHSAGIGGGHFLLYYDREQQQMVYYDAREVAPLAATEYMYEDDPKASSVGGLAVAVPGEIAGFWLAHQHYGKLNWTELFEPTIQLAQQGFEVSKELARVISLYEEEIRNETSLSEIFFNSEGEPLEKGDIMYRPLLAETLQKIADGGRVMFYEGTVAEDVVNDITDRGGIITLEDLQRYTVTTPEPLVIKLAAWVGDLDFYLPPPPGSGAVLALILNILEGYDIDRRHITDDSLSTLTYHRVVESFKFSYAERSYLGDPDFVDVTELVSNMTSKEYASAIRSLIEDCCTHNVDYYFSGPPAYSVEDYGTSHLSVVDQEGNAVAATSTINLSFGAKFRGSRTGILFNNEMDDFSMPNDTNAYNIPPSPENFIEPEKRPFSSMVPLIAIDGYGNVQLVAGGSGGKIITTGVAQVVLNTIWGDDNMKDAIERSRLHNQLIPSETKYEPDFKQYIVRGLEDKGHNMTKSSSGMECQGIRRTDSGLLDAACDSRKGGYPAGF